MQAAPIFSITIIVVLICITCVIVSVIRYKKKEKTPEIKMKAKRKAIIFLISFLLIGIVWIIAYRISHKEWCEVTGNIKSNFSEISKISYEKPTPILYIDFDVDETVSIDKMEEIFLCFLEEFNEDFLNELIKNTGSHEPWYIEVCFAYITDKQTHILVFSTEDKSDYTNWICKFPKENNSIYGKKYKSKIIV